MSTQPQAPGLPREIAPGIFWIGDCNERVTPDGERLHSYLSVYMVTGVDRSLIVDAGAPKDWAVLEAQYEGLVAQGIPPVEYIFPTHVEVPHCGNLGRWLNKLPELKVVGDVRDLELMFPNANGRLFPKAVGDSISLGGTEFVFLDGVIRDLVTTLWGYDTRRKVMFPGDGFAYSHEHHGGHCGRFAEEVPELRVAEFTANFADAALYWTRFVDIEPYIQRLDDLFERYPTELIGPAHGLPIRDPTTTMPKIKDGLRLCQQF